MNVHVQKRINTYVCICNLNSENVLVEYMYDFYFEEMK